MKQVESTPEEFNQRKIYTYKIKIKIRSLVNQSLSHHKARIYEEIEVNKPNLKKSLQIPRLEKRI